MKRVVVITTGGTIAMKRSPMAGGAVPMLKGEDFLSQLPRSGIDVAFEEFANLPSSHLTPAQILNLGQRAEALLRDPAVAGVVVTHGTDTLEESAYLLDLTLTSEKPVVFTGSMRTATSASYDGIRNLVAAIHVAAAPEAEDQGVLVVFNDTILAASEAQKVHSQLADAFAAPGSGPVGHVEGERVWMRHRVAPRLVIPCAKIEERVDLIRIAQGTDDRQLRHAIEDGVAGVVVESLGGGRVPPWWMPALGDALARRIAVAVTTRCGAGSLHDEYGYVGAYHDLERLGVLFAHHLTGVKARIKLMVALGTPRRSAELRALFAA